MSEETLKMLAFTEAILILVIFAVIITQGERIKSLQESRTVMMEVLICQEFNDHPCLRPVKWAVK